ncbi:stage III sporulation protein AF [Lederbergia citrea]|uniref:Stage III sporulation protein AF n=1 Tax=Lederbergia citrea TaxID=2833581 RepID=A0A942Z4F4_9BACI|nr:stage III sporulation protein AF [Lederbergia citrea]MBS4176380.1 stage III sporulation protein AF [Lederbergia citrea]MBS4202941.1 stage III sporulation protein AF [Lederbergia citrea]MBS4222387.1 stage III sporulation protein AF [Lederbergia citrea]
MGVLSEWIVNIIIFLLLAMIIDMILPNSNIKKYAKLVTGLLLMAIIITPIFKIMSTDFEEVLASFTINLESDEQFQENLLETKKKEIQASTHAYILEQMAVQMKVEVEKELMEKYRMAIASIQLTAEADIEPTNDQLQRVIVHIEPSEEDVAAIKPVNINIRENVKSDHTSDYETIRAMLSARWEITETIIEIVPSGGAE